MDYYLLFIWGCVEPELVGPFASPEERDQKAKEYWEQNRDPHGYYTLEVTNGCQVEVGCFPGDLFEDE